MSIRAIQTGQGWDVDDIPASSSELEALGCFNFNRVTMAGMIAARAKALAGQRGRVLIAGDSKVAGAGSGTTGAGATALVGARVKSWPSVLARMLNGSGVPASNDNFWGSQGVLDDTGVTYQAYDPRMGAFTGSVTWATNFLGGKMLLLDAASEAVAFTPTSECDGAIIYYVRVSGGGTATVNVDGGAPLATINANGGSAIMTQTVSFSRGTHTINIAHNGTGTNFYILGILPTDSTTGAIDIIQAGYFGATTNLFAANTQPWDPVNVAVTLAPDHTFYVLGTNDAVLSLPIATFEANVRTMANALIAAGSGFTFVVHSPINPASSTIRQNAAAIRAKLKSLASEYNCACIDLTDKWGAHPSDSQGGSRVPSAWYFDNLHESALGYGDIASGIHSALQLL